MNASVHIGTSGWHYNHWQGTFYPEGMASGERLAFYSGLFMDVEINNSFYQLPEVETLEKWRQTVSDGFLFAVKASRYITHMKKLKDASEPVARFIQHISILDDRLGPVLFQMPPKWQCNVNRLREFLSILPQDKRFAFEFRDPSWFDDGILSVLKDAGAAFCIYELAGRQSPKEVTGDFVYVRLHGPGKAYEGSYSQQALAGWAGAFSSWKEQGKDVFCFFDNDQLGYAPANALSLLKMLNKG